MIIRTLYVLALALSCCSKAAPPATAEAIVAKYLEAIGGLEAHAKLTTRQLEGTLKIHGMEGDIAMTITQKAPDKKHTTLVHPFFQGMEVANGERAWGRMVGQDLQMFEDQEKEQKLRDARFHAAVEMITEGEISYEKDITIGAKDCHLLVGKYGDGSPWAGMAVDFYIDTETYLLHRLGIMVPVGAKLEKGVIDFSGYMNIDGITLPRRAEIRAGGVHMTIKINKVRHGVAVDDALFVAP